MYKPPEATGHHKLLKLLILLPVRANLLGTLQCETPCIKVTKLIEIGMFFEMEES